MREIEVAEVVPVPVLAARLGAYSTPEDRLEVGFRRADAHDLPKEGFERWRTDRDSHDG